MPSNFKICPECEYEFISEESAEKEVVDIELHEITQLEILKKQHHDYYRNIRTFDDMVRFQKAKKYKFGWVIRKCMELKIDIPSKYRFMIERFYA